MSIDRQGAARAFGQALKAARLAKGLSQEELAEEAELDRTTPSLYERGLRTPTLSVVIEIAQALGLEPAQLVSETLKRLREDQHDCAVRIHSLSEPHDQTLSYASTGGTTKRPSLARRG